MRPLIFDPLRVISDPLRVSVSRVCQVCSPLASAIVTLLCSLLCLSLLLTRPDAFGPRGPLVGATMSLMFLILFAYFAALCHLEAVAAEFTHVDRTATTALTEAVQLRQEMRGLLDRRRPTAGALTSDAPDTPVWILDSTDPADPADATWIDDHAKRIEDHTPTDAAPTPVASHSLLSSRPSCR